MLEIEALKFEKLFFMVSNYDPDITFYSYKNKKTEVFYTGNDFFACYDCNGFLLFYVNGRQIWKREYSDTFFANVFETDKGKFFNCLEIENKDMKISFNFEKFLF